MGAASVNVPSGQATSIVRPWRLVSGSLSKVAVEPLARAEAQGCWVPS